MTEPTDAKLIGKWTAEWIGMAHDVPRNDTGALEQRIETSVERLGHAVVAAIAKWGTPPAVAGEPECTCSAKDMPFGICCKVRSAFERWYDEQNDGRLQPFDVFKGGWIERHRLSSTPQPTQAQAGAVPLTAYQIHEAIKAFKESENLMGVNHIHVARAIERAHGIKGGQHGADTRSD